MIEYGETESEMLDFLFDRLTHEDMAIIGNLHRWSTPAHVEAHLNDHSIMNCYTFRKAFSDFLIIPQSDMNRAKARVSILANGGEDI